MVIKGSPGGTERQGGHRVTGSMFTHNDVSDKINQLTKMDTAQKYLNDCIDASLLPWMSLYSFTTVVR